ncbi:MAG: hypothetical protein JWM98_2063 [Thermoleophilia bacterium]|nr:hypothetical protein [Thermoleophilia bacterium]
MGIFGSIKHAGSALGHGAANVATSTAHAVTAAPAAVVNTATNVAATGAHNLTQAGAGAAHLAVKAAKKPVGALASAASGAAHLGAKLPQVAAARKLVHTAASATKKLPSIAAHGAHAAAAVGHKVSHAAHGVANLAKSAGSHYVKAVKAVATAPARAALAGAHYVNKHSRGIAYGLGAAALVTSFIPGVNAISPALALGAAGLSALNTYKDVKTGASPLQTAFDAVGVLPGAGATLKLAKANKLAKGVLPTLHAIRVATAAQHVITGSRVLTAARVGVTTARNATS